MEKFRIIWNKFWRIITVIVIISIANGCISITRSHKSEEERTVVTPTTIVNLRSGPGTDYKIIKGVRPGINLTVNGNLDDEWIAVTTDDGVSAYVASKYVKVISGDAGPDIKETIYPSKKNDGKEDSNVIMDSVSSNVSAYTTSYSFDDSVFSSYMRFMMSTGGYIVTICVFLLEMLIIFYFRRKYDYGYTNFRPEPATPAILAIVISLVFTVFQTIAIFSVRDGKGPLDLYFIFMLLSTGLVMAVVPWCLRLSGLAPHVQHLSAEGDKRANWATKLGNWTWSILLIPISILWIQYAGYGDHKIFSNSSFWSMVFNMTLFTAGAWFFCAIIWPCIVIKYFLTSMNSKLLAVLNAVLVIGMARYEYYACDESFTGINYVVSLYLLVLSVMLYVGPLFTTVNELRCSNCHSFEGQYTHTTDLGYSDYTSKEWQNCDSSKITPRNRDAVISDSQRLVSTTKRTSKWKTHHECAYCDHRWEIENQSTETIDSHTVKRKWKETYIN